MPDRKTFNCKRLTLNVPLKAGTDFLELQPDQLLNDEKQFRN
jgi:hypothetical protein